MMAEKTIIKAKKDMYNSGLCFVKDKIYEVRGNIHSSAGLMESYTTNELKEPHLIGSWWRNFKIIDRK